jgi:hypothetical protein
MHGSIFVTFEKFVEKHLGVAALSFYRSYLDQEIGSHRHILINRVYPDEVLVKGMELLSAHQNISADELVYNYGRYYIANELTGYLCSHLLQRVNNARALLLVMSHAHLQLQFASQSVLAPPVFEYEHHPYDSTLLTLIYKDPRKLCSLLHGAIEGAGERYHEQVAIYEETCMKRGDPACRFLIRFLSGHAMYTLQAETPQESQRRELLQLVLQALPEQPEQAITLHVLSLILQRFPNKALSNLHLSALYMALLQLQAVGLISTLDAPTTTLAQRRYWRVPRVPMRQIPPHVSHNSSS